MEYILTADDIRRFPELQGFEGEPATPEEMVAMGMTPPAEPAGPAFADPTKGGDPVYTAARNAGADVDAALLAQNPTMPVGPDIRADSSLYTRNVSMPSAVSTMGGASSSMMDLLSTPVPQDPFENLSRNQRMMLGFAAMKDAGMALMGKDSSAVAGVMGDFTERANMERKRRAALAQAQTEKARQAQINALLMGLPVGAAPAAGGDGAAGAKAQPSDISAQIAALDAMAGTYAALGQMDVYTAKRAALVDQRDYQGETSKEAAVELEKKEKDAKAFQATIRSAEGSLSVAERALRAATGLDGAELDELLKEAIAADADGIDGKKFLVSRGTGLEAEGYKNFKSAVNELGAVMTFQNLTAIVEQGVRLGTLSDADMAVLKDMTGTLDVENMPEQTADTVFRLYKGISETIRRLKIEEMENKYKQEG